MPSRFVMAGRASVRAKGEKDVDETRGRSAGRAEVIGGVATALLAVAAFAGHATQAGLPWWAVSAVAVSTVGLAGWTRRPDRPSVRSAVRVGERVGERVPCGRVDLRDHAVSPARDAAGRGAAW
ncbi:hypothetical protein AB0K68_05320 [Streptomyces sp. NPDC050698]